MNKKKIIYAVTVADILDIAKQKNAMVKEKDLDLISDNVGDYFGCIWQDAIEYAIERLNKE